MTTLRSKQQQQQRQSGRLLSPTELFVTQAQETEFDAAAGEAWLLSLERRCCCAERSGKKKTFLPLLERLDFRFSRHCFDRLDNLFSFFHLHSPPVLLKKTMHSSSMRATLRPALPARPAAGGAAARRPAARGANSAVVRARAHGDDDEERKTTLCSPSFLQRGVAALLAGLFVTAAAPVDAAALSGSAYSKVSWIVIRSRGKGGRKREEKEGKR